MPPRSAVAGACARSQRAHHHHLGALLPLCAGCCTTDPPLWHPLPPHHQIRPTRAYMLLHAGPSAQASKTKSKAAQPEASASDATEVAQPGSSKRARKAAKAASDAEAATSSKSDKSGSKRSKKSRQRGGADSEEGEEQGGEAQAGQQQPQAPSSSGQAPSASEAAAAKRKALIFEVKMQQPSLQVRGECWGGGGGCTQYRWLWCGWAAFAEPPGASSPQQRTAGHTRARSPHPSNVCITHSGGNLMV